jgi:predicted MFS family arabinose efflux permease/mannose/fructose-specific phosphotransferase system component IIA
VATVNDAQPRREGGPENPKAWSGATVTMFLAFAFAYFLSTLLRAAPATLANAFSQELKLSSGDLGLLAGAYFFGFSLTQLPLGQALDRFGPRRVLCTLLVLACLGCLWFARATDLHGLVLSRMLIGVGVSACLMAPLTAFRMRLPPQQQLRANAWMLMTGSLGMLASTLPLHWLLPLWGWRGIFDGIGVAVVLAIMVLIWRVPGRAHVTQPMKPAAVKPADTPGAVIGYAKIFSHPRFVQLIPAGLFIYGGMIAMQALWVGPWLSRVAQASPTEAAAGLFFVNATMLVTFFGWGVVMPRLTRAGVDAHRLMRWGMALPMLVLPIILWMGAHAGAGTWAVWCVCCTCVTLSQPLVAQEFPSSVAGRALSAYNLVLFVGIFLVQWGVGALIDHFATQGWSVVSSFRGALAVFWALSVAAYTWYLAFDRRAKPIVNADNSKPMTQLILLAHAPLASAMKAVALHTFPSAVVTEVDVASDEAPDGVERRLRAVIAQSRGSTLVLCDVQGATPCNAAQAVAQEGTTHVVAGVNVPMLWRVLCYASEPLDVLTQRAIAGGGKGIVSVSNKSQDT